MSIMMMNKEEQLKMIEEVLHNDHDLLNYIENVLMDKQQQETVQL